MDQIWLKVFGVMIGGSVLKYIIVHPIAWVVIDLAVLGVAYVLLKRHPYVDLKTSMYYLGGLTAVSVLVDLGVLSGMIGNVAILALLFWMLYGGGSGRRRPPRRRF